MRRKEKANVVDQLKDKLGKAESVFLADFTGINVKDVNELRTKFRDAEVEYLVAKNTLIRRAVADTPLADLDPYLEGPTALVISSDQGVTAAKIIDEFRGEHDALKLKGGILSEKIIEAATIEELAKLPTRDELIAKLMGSLNAPVSRLVFVLNDTIGRAVRVLAQVAQSKESEDQG
jgi:large subunit ribosomal protein L10